MGEAQGSREDCGVGDAQGPRRHVWREVERGGECGGGGRFIIQSDRSEKEGDCRHDGAPRDCACSGQGHRLGGLSKLLQLHIVSD